MKNGFYIGGVDKSTIEMMSSAIRDILYAGTGDNVKIAALEVLGNGVQAPHNISISGCNLDMSEENCCRQEEKGVSTLSKTVLTETSGKIEE